jgi:CRISPR-associated protein Csm3
MDRNLLGKIQLSGKIKCLTGLHIGASKENIEIGAIDSPVVRDPVTREPYIPGSSLKGKMRALLEKALATELNIVGEKNRRNIGTRSNEVWIHVCDDAEKAIECPICRIFGSTGQGNGKNFPSRLLVRDAYLTEESVKELLEEIDTGLLYTEWKFENAIDRVTSAANPRQLERVPRGAEFNLEIIYNVEETDTVEEDLKNIFLAIELIKLDAIGGHGSRGYGKVDISFDCKKLLTVEALKSQQFDGEEFEEINEIINKIRKQSK